MSTRGFSSSQPFVQPQRTLEDAPAGLRAEATDTVFSIAEAYGQQPQGLYRTIALTLGIADAAVQPYGGVVQRAAQYLGRAEWPRFYDVIVRLAPDFVGWGAFHEYRARLNQQFAAYGVAWDLTANGTLERVLPTPLADAVRGTFDDLDQPGYEGALELFRLAKTAFDERPFRRDRDAAANAFDAMEAAAKVKFQMPAATFGAVLDEARRRQALHEDVQQILRRVEVLRHHHLGHGNPQPFALGSAEVDFVYITCAAGARLFARP